MSAIKRYVFDIDMCVKAYLAVSTHTLMNICAVSLHAACVRKFAASASFAASARPYSCGGLPNKQTTQSPDILDGTRYFCYTLRPGRNKKPNQTGRTESN